MIEKILTHLSLQARAPSRARPWVAAASGLTVSIHRHSGGPDPGAAGIGCVRASHGQGSAGLAASSHEKTRRQPVRMTHFRAAVDTQRVTAEPNEYINGPSGATPGALWEKRAFEKPSV